MRKISMWLLVSLGILLCLAVDFILLFDWNWVKDELVGRAGEAAGRDIAIDGDLSVDWSLKPRITAEGIRLENTAWGSTENMVTVERLAVRIDLLELLRFRVEDP